MEVFKIEKLWNLDENYKTKAIELFVDGFYNIFSFSKDKKILQELFIQSLDFSIIYVCLHETNVVGFLGIGNNKKRPACFDKSVCQKLLGKVKGFIVYNQLSVIMEKPAVKGEKDLYIDYLTTDKKYGRKGIATKLINFVCDELDFNECYIEVLSKNENAKRLYEKIGFKEYKRIYNPFIMMQGLGVAIKMKRQIKKL
ncbi:GNAT family N-acetyltransferase [Clostridium hydrogeniformans]|uniref:GNAT family N-acetyltransferase n=1 Tax=Clostridium hydrogeniformans TaxID=349933 RepID=UPI00047FFBB0|nr:N-acetyltransferase [Clostridium hydrogeniformans]